MTQTRVTRLWALVLLITSSIGLASAIATHAAALGTLAGATLLVSVAALIVLAHTHR